MSFLYNNYLFQCDYFYKHKIKHLNFLPAIQSLSIRFDLSVFNKELEEGLKGISTMDTQLIGFLMSYLNTNSRPFIYLSKVKNSNYSLKHLYIGRHVNKFLFKNFPDFYSYFLSKLLLEPLKNTNLYSFKNSLTNMLFLKFYLKELFNISNLKKNFVVFNITLR